MKRRKPNAKERELQANWEALLKRQSQPLNTKTKSAGLRDNQPGLKVAPAVNPLHKARMPGNGANVQYIAMEISEDAVRRRVREAMGVEEYERREQQAKRVKHCVMPLHKGGYMLVTDPSIVPQMGKKTA